MGPRSPESKGRPRPPRASPRLPDFCQRSVFSKNLPELSRGDARRAPTGVRALSRIHTQGSGRTKSMFRKALLGLAALALVAAPMSRAASAQSTNASNFSGPFFGPLPKGDPNSIEVNICNLIGAATQSVDMANYKWSSQAIVDAMIAAAQKL